MSLQCDLPKSLLDQEMRRLVAEKGWTAGTTFENRIMRALSMFEMGPVSQFGTQQQYKVGRYKLDFAWPPRLIGLEADGAFHRTPEIAVKDAIRDAWLRNNGWVIFRVDDTGTEDQLLEQILRVCRFVRSESATWAADLARRLRNTNGVSVPLTHRQRGQIGGLRRSALAPTPGSITQAARDGRFRKYVAQVKAALPDLTDEAEITRRAETLRRADMIELSARAADARRRKP